jgi:hypothetical protein
MITNRHYWKQALRRSAKPTRQKKKVSAKAVLPSAFYRALGKVFVECPTLGKVQNEKILKK